MIYTCLSLLTCNEDVGLHLCNACPRGPTSPRGTSGCYCTARSWARILPPFPGHNPKRRNPASGWSQAPGRALEADFPEQQGAPDIFPSASQAEQQELSCLIHGIRQTRTLSQLGVPIGREPDTSVHHRNIHFLFGRQQKNTAKACW